MQSKIYLRTTTASDNTTDNNVPKKRKLEIEGGDCSKEESDTEAVDLDRNPSHLLMQELIKYLSGTSDGDKIYVVLDDSGAEIIDTQLREQGYTGAKIPNAFKLDNLKLSLLSLKN